MESNLAQDEPWDQLADITLVGMTPGLPRPDLLDILRAAAPQVIAVTAISAAETRDDDARPDTVWLRDVKRWLILTGGIIAGLIIGYLLGAFISVNVLGVSYEASLGDIWKDDPTAIWVMAIIATTGGTAGGLLAWRMSS